MRAGMIGLWILGALFVVMALLMVTGCGNELSEGTVMSKEDQPAHSEEYMVQQYAGEDCVYSSVTKSNICTPHYIWVPATRWVPERWVLHLRHCRQKDDGTEKCRNGVAYVSQDVYASYKNGDYYQRVKGDSKPSAGKPVEH